MYRFIQSRVQKLIPKISETEKIALRSGGVHVDRDIFKGSVNVNQYVPQQTVHVLEDMRPNVTRLLEKVSSSPIYPSDQIYNIMKTAGDEKMMGMIIKKKYGGTELPVSVQSKILTTISSYNPSLGVSIMVPNSLGPGELLQHYGTNEQQQFYLPKLANGSFVPCFGLTGPHNGSDATGSIDSGVIVKDSNNKLFIRVTIDKRYITLAPISNLVGLAIDVKDPDQHLPETLSGITLVLLETEHYPTLQQNYHHNPNNVGFPNGPLKGSLEIPIENVIGGSSKIGHGWPMLMECLAVGRGVSLPATANASSKTLTYAMWLYTKHRRQFKLPLAKMEGVQEKFMNMFFHTWVIQSAVAFTNCILDSGATPSVITAIMKQQTTERARNVILDGMDIFAGSGICIGPNNIFTKFYNAAPVGVTVEGSNVLTRSLIIFGQGLNKSHPYIFPLLESIEQDDTMAFQKQWNQLMGHVFTNYLFSLQPLSMSSSATSRLRLVTKKFANTSNFVALLAGGIKSKQILSGKMADAMSSIFLAYSVIWYHEYHMTSHQKPLLDYCVHRLCEEAERSINDVIQMYPIQLLRPLLLLCQFPSIKTTEFSPSVFHLLFHDNHLLSELKADVFIDPMLAKMETLDSISPDHEMYPSLYNDVISVGEFQMEPVNK